MALLPGTRTMGKGSFVVIIKIAEQHAWKGWNFLEAVKEPFFLISLNVSNQEISPAG